MSKCHFCKGNHWLYAEGHGWTQTGWKTEDLENRSKQNNIIWGMEEGSERDHNSKEEFIGAAIF